MGTGSSTYFKELRASLLDYLTKRYPGTRIVVTNMYYKVLFPVTLEDALKNANEGEEGYR